MTRWWGTWCLWLGAPTEMVGRFVRFGFARSLIPKLHARRFRLEPLAATSRCDVSALFVTALPVARAATCVAFTSRHPLALTHALRSHTNTRRKQEQARMSGFGTLAEFRSSSFDDAVLAFAPARAEWQPMPRVSNVSSREMRAHQAERPLETYEQQLQLDDLVAPRGIAKEQQQRLLRPTKVTTSSTCPVCLCELERNVSHSALGRCKHVFHTRCISAWLDRAKTCPVCRAGV